MSKLTITQAIQTELTDGSNPLRASDFRPTTREHFLVRANGAVVYRTAKHTDAIRYQTALTVEFPFVTATVEIR